MNLVKMFEDQKVVRNKIIETHNLQGKDLLPNLILALQVELGELANEWRGFKHWSADREPRNKKMRGEYADCLAFTLEIGIELGYEQEYHPFEHPTIIDSFIYLNQRSGDLLKSKSHGDYGRVIMVLLGLGKMLGFTEQEIVDAYYKKHAINLQRQENGY